MIAFAVSRDGEQVAYFLYHPNRLVIRRTESGEVVGEVSLEGSEFADLPSLDWSRDESLVLVRRWPGPEHETQYDLICVRDRRVERTGMSGEIYSFFPTSDRFLGAHWLYDRSDTSPRRGFFSVAVSGRDTVNLSLPLCRDAWHANVSPDESLIAYPCNQGIVMSALARGEGHKSDVNVAVGRVTVIGWIVR